MSGLVIFLAVMRRSDTVGVRGKIVEFGSSLVPVVSASPALVAHESLLYEVKLNYNMPKSRDGFQLTSVIFKLRVQLREGSD